MAAAERVQVGTMQVQTLADDVAMCSRRARFVLLTYPQIPQCVISMSTSVASKSLGLYACQTIRPAHRELAECLTADEREALGTFD